MSLSSAWQTYTLAIVSRREFVDQTLRRKHSSREGVLHPSFGKNLLSREIWKVAMNVRNYQITSNILNIAQSIRRDAWSCTRNFTMAIWMTITWSWCTEFMKNLTDLGGLVGLLLGGVGPTDTKHWCMSFKEWPHGHESVWYVQIKLYVEPLRYQCSFSLIWFLGIELISFT